MALERQPIFGLIRILEDDAIARECIRFVQFQGLQYVHDLADYSKQQLVGLGVSDVTLNALECSLRDQYQLTFSAQGRAQPAFDRELERGGFSNTDVALGYLRRPRGGSYRRAAGAPPQRLYHVLRERDELED